MSVGYWHCLRSMRSRVYATVGRTSVCLSVRLSVPSSSAKFAYMWSSRQEISIDCCTALSSATGECGQCHVASVRTHTHPFNGPFSGTTQVSRYQKGKTNLDFTGARDSEWQWHKLGHMQVCTSLQTDNHASTPPLCFYRPDALPVSVRNSVQIPLGGPDQNRVSNVWSCRF